VCVCQVNRIEDLSWLLSPNGNQRQLSVNCIVLCVLLAVCVLPNEKLRLGDLVDTSLFNEYLCVSCPSPFSMLTKYNAHTHTHWIKATFHYYYYRIVCIRIHVLSPSKFV
jgi:hypothetical protein